MPYKVRGDYFYSRYEKAKQYPVHCRKIRSLKNDEQILLNVNKLAKGKSFCTVKGLRLSPNKTIMAYGADFVGRRIYTIYFKNLKTGRLLSHKLEGTTGSACFTDDGKSVYYTKKDFQTLRPHQIYRYDFENKKETLIYEEKDDTFRTSVFQSWSRNLIMIGCYSTLSTEYHFKSAQSADGEFNTILKREKNHEYYPAERGGEFWIQTNWKAQNFRLMKCSIDKRNKKDWKVVIPHRKTILLESFLVFKDFLVVQQRQNGLTGIQITDFKNWQIACA